MAYTIMVLIIINSFSRKVLWLKCSSTNRDAKVIARYYLECVEHFGGTMSNAN